MKLSNIIIPLLLLSVASINSANSQTTPALGKAKSFAVLAASTITNTGATIIKGDVGLSPGSSITGFGPGKILDGAQYTGAASIAGDAKTAATALYNDLAGRKTNVIDMTGQDLGNKTLKPGIYKFSSSVGITGTLTLDDSDDPNAIFIFQIGSTITTATSSKVVMKSGGKGPNVFWQVGSSATIGTYTTFAGNILALASITMTTGATTTGRLFAMTAAVTFDTNTAYALSEEIADKDGDGIPDLMDDYPTDATKAFNTYSSTGEGSTLAFEDQWPLKGDFDLNDLVITYKYTVVTNAKNKVVQVIGNYKLHAAGGSIGNGFGVMFPIERSKIDQIEGAVLEENQRKAVIILFDNMHKELVNGNTEPGKPQSEAKNYTVKFDISNGPLLEDFGTDFNPFLFYTEGTSRHEIHKIGKEPTDLVDKSLFGSKDDGSDLASGNYYVTKTGLPYVIDVPAGNFQYPIEGKDVTLAYLHFAEWAASGGKSFIDWYSNLAKDFRNQNFIFSK
ncbi:MAG: LruC domain-containing protein [Pedobacter sp.]|nr:MAG: LruC domain-containing protein [Pedobacter sp.]